MRIHHVLTMGIVVLLAAGCGDDGGGKDDVIDGAPPADTAPGGADGSPGGGDAAPGGADASPVADSGAGAADAATGVLCGDQPCDPGTECCVTAGGASCVEPGTCDGATIGCDGPEDCADTDVCCGGATTECAPADTCAVEVCHTSDDCQDPAQECCLFPGAGSSVCLDRCTGP